MPMAEKFIPPLIIKIGVCHTRSYDGGSLARCLEAVQFASQQLPSLRSLGPLYLNDAGFG